MQCFGVKSHLDFSCSGASLLGEVLTDCGIVQSSRSLHLWSVSLDSQPQIHLSFIGTICPDGCYKSEDAINTVDRRTLGEGMMDSEEPESRLGPTSQDYAALISA